MSETNPSIIKLKKTVRRNVALALGIICIILVGGLLGAILQISSLNSKVSDLTDTINLGKSAILVNSQTVSQTADNYTSWVFNPGSQSEVSKPIGPMPSNWSIKYAGILSVNVQSSTTNKTYVRVIYGASWYDNQVDVGKGVDIEFAVLPVGNIEIRVGNTNTNENATETVTITYYY